jgi:hypothetical protein
MLINTYFPYLLTTVRCCCYCSKARYSCSEPIDDTGLARRHSKRESFGAAVGRTKPSSSPDTAEAIGRKLLDEST